MKRGRRRACRGARSLRLWPVGGGRKARRGEVAVAEPWVGVDSSKPPRLFATVVALVAGGGLATTERPQVAVAGTII